VRVIAAMGIKTRRAAVAALFAGSAALVGLPAAAQAVAKAPAPAAKPAKKATPPVEADDEEATVSELVVTGARARPQPGAVTGDIKPEVQLSPAEIQSYGVSTVTELLDELAPQIESGRGRGGEQPVVLLNGRRISGFNEIRDIPTEAIQRVDILPEEVALKYGYTADQKVVNFVLRRFFLATTVEAGGKMATEGGAESGNAEIDHFRVIRDNRLNLDLKVQGSAALTEDERGLTPLSAGLPFDLKGNVTSATPGGEIDPVLSGLLGRPVTVVGLPAAIGGPLKLGDVGPAANATDVGAYRTLTPKTREASANGVLTRVLPAGFQGTINATLGATSSDSLRGLPGASVIVPAGDPFSPFSRDVAVDRYLGAFGPLRQQTEGWTAHLGGALNRDAAKWRFSLTGAYDHGSSLTRSDVGVDVSALSAAAAARAPSFNPFAPWPADLLVRRGQEKAQSDTDAVNVHALASGPLWQAPAGPLYASLRVGEAGSWLASESERLTGRQSADLSRNTLSAQANIDLPLTSRSKDVLAFVGDLSVNGNAAINHLSDFGDLTVVGFGMNWTPVTGVNLIVSHTHDEAAPSMAQLGGPVVTTAGARVFDFATGRTVDVRRIDGGNPALVGDVREVTKVGLTLKPLAGQDLTITANYVKSRIRNPIETFPAATAEVEAAFPDRFLRDTDGNLTVVDNRPVNFARERKEQLRWGFNYSRPFGPQPPPRRFPPGGGERRPAGPPPPDGPESGARADQTPAAAEPRVSDAGSPRSFGGGGPGGARGGGFGGRGPGGRIQVALYHTIYFEDELLVRAGGPTFDLLHGSAAGNGGGQPRHQVEAQFGITEKGLGARLSANWKSATEVKGVPGSPTGDLHFGDLAKVDLRLFANLGQNRELVAKHPFLRGTRVTVSALNLFDAREKVTDATGATPVGYQAAYLDPVGRTVSISFRKLFFPPLPVPPPGFRPRP
jgi:hypothetical protein